MSFHEYRWPWVAAIGFMLFFIPFRKRGISSLADVARFWPAWLMASVVLGVSCAGTLTRGQWNSNSMSSPWAQAHWQIEFWLWTLLPLSLGLAQDVAKGFRDWSGAHKGLILGLALGPMAAKALPLEAWLALAPVVLILGVISAFLGRWLALPRYSLWPFRGLIALNFAFLMQGLLDPPSPILAALLFLAMAFAYGPATWRWNFLAAILAWLAALARDHFGWPEAWWPALAPMAGMVLGWTCPLFFARRTRAS